MRRTVKINITNNFKESRTLMLEPWGEDYGMMPGDEFEIIEKQANDEFYFHIVFDEYISVYAEGQADSYHRIYKNGIEPSCGFNRI